MPPAPIDLAPYLTWYVARHQRRYGSQPAKSTIKTKRSYLTTTARMLDCPD